MQRTSIKNLANKNIIFICLLFLFILGMFYGTLLIKSDNDSVWSQLEIITNEYRAIQMKQSLITTFINSFLSSLIFLIIPYIFGYSSIGQIGTFFIPFFYGLGLGCALGYLYMNYGVKGILYSAVIVIPHSVITLFALLIGCRESTKLSSLIFLGFFSSNAKSVNSTTIKLYNIKFFILCLMIVIASVINVLTVMLFSKLFI